MAADEPLRTSVADDAGSLAAALRVAAATPAAPPGELEPGAVIGEHFVIEAALGRGGMGVVYRARDRRLDRAVALKLHLRGADLTRARREAVALARLAHPNVVTIHEIGEHGGAPFVAMELCDGGNARTWRKAAPRTWREILAVYLDAGRGLAAAHAAGLVHRDVKPDNILLGSDGRARIGDFGLARDAAGLASDAGALVSDAAGLASDAGALVSDAAGLASDAAALVSDAAGLASDAAALVSDAAGLVSDAAGLAGDRLARSALAIPDVDQTTTTGPSTAGATADAAIATTHAAAIPDRSSDRSPDRSPNAATPARESDAVTAVGAIVGTPRYMAPEQLGVGSVDARADQFAFCVALTEALGGLPSLPLPAERAVAIAVGRAAPLPRPRSVPRRVHAVLARGLRADPDARWPDMAGLCRALTRAQRRRWPIAAAAAALIAALVLAVVIDRASAGRAAIAPCADIAGDLSAIWNPKTRAAFLARHSAFASSAGWAAEALDRDVATWATARTAACRDLPRSPGWSPRMARGSSRCLRRGRDAIAQVAATTAPSAAELVADIDDLIDPAGCADEVKLTGTPEPDLRNPVMATRYEYVRQLGALADHAVSAGDHVAALALAREAERVAHGDHDPLLSAIADYAMGRVLLAQEGLNAAGPPLRAAFFEIRQTTDSVETAAVATLLANAYLGANQLDLADEWLDHARAEAIRVHQSPINRSNIDAIAAQVAQTRGHHDEALAINQRVIDDLTALHQPRADVMLAHALGDRAMMLGEAGRTAESAALSRRALAIEERRLGADHPELLPSLGNLGLDLLDLGEIDEGSRLLARALAIADARLPHDSVEYAYTVWNHAIALGKRDPAAARPRFDEAIAILVRQLGPDHADVTQARADRAALDARPK